MSTHSYVIVDAFADEPFHGNPAAVVFDGGELADAVKQRVAAEFNLSETVFVLPTAGSAGGATVRLRWFTPRCEVSFCGHATLAAVHAVCERSVEPPGEVAVECAAGKLSVRTEIRAHGGRCYWLAMPSPELRESGVPLDAVLDALRAPRLTEPLGPMFETRDRDLVLLVTGGSVVRSLSPNMDALARLSETHALRGFCVASTDTGDRGVACISRFFAPAAGVPEDPVTGSVHGPLAAILVRGRLVAPAVPNRWSFLCRQVPANGRAGTVHVRAERRGDDWAIEVGGSCRTVMTGTLTL